MRQISLAFWSNVGQSERNKISRKNKELSRGSRRDENFKEVDFRDRDETENSKEVDFRDRDETENSEK